MLEEAMDHPAGLVFDAYGTLLDVASVAAACEARWPGRGAALTTLWRERQLQYSWLRSIMGRHADFWQLTGEALDFACAALGLDLAPADREALLAGYLRLSPFPEVASALGRLGGLRRMVLSNGTPAMLRAGLEHAGLAGHLEAILSVEDVGVFKPAPPVYAMATAHLGCAPADILFVSSNGWDIAGAASFGLRTAWLNRAGAPAERLGVAPEIVVPDLAALADVILA
ncbi:haloacid dehalogenase type II [Oscillochloris sp. ZM17-4]|uniref:haloacid dehalogenase type II n=1 Tax=Oscillochloris sp. ZM17-4 TaxID=2866714 RepID=UPI00351CE166